MLKHLSRRCALQVWISRCRRSLRKYTVNIERTTKTVQDSANIKIQRYITTSRDLRRCRGGSQDKLRGRARIGLGPCECCDSFRAFSCLRLNFAGPSKHCRIWLLNGVLSPVLNFSRTRYGTLPHSRVPCMKLCRQPRVNDGLTPYASADRQSNVDVDQDWRHHTIRDSILAWVRSCLRLL